MEVIGKLQEYILIAVLTKKDQKKLEKHVESSFVVLWNNEKETTISIDNVKIKLKPHQIMFLTEFHKVNIDQIDKLNILKFNRNFYCIDNHDSEIGCRGVLFFGASQVPIVSLDEEHQTKIELLWKVFLNEMKSTDEMQIEMLQILMKRFLILCTRIYKENNNIIQIDESKMDVIRNFTFLVEVHFRTKHSVAEYADLMNKPAKSLTNLFSNHIEKTPLQIIQDRIVLEARRLLLFSETSIKEITFELGFEDMPSFSRFFKNKVGVSPRNFRNDNEQLLQK